MVIVCPSTVAQWLGRSAVEPKDVGSILAVAVVFPWRQNPKTPVCCVTAVHVKVPQVVENNSEPSNAASLITHVTLGRLTP